MVVLQLSNEDLYDRSYSFQSTSKTNTLSMFKEVRDHLQQLLTAGLIRKSKSQFPSNIVLLRKKNRYLRMYVDYRQLNNKSDYHQIEIEESHTEKTEGTKLSHKKCTFFQERFKYVGHKVSKQGIGTVRFLVFCRYMNSFLYFYFRINPG